MKNLCKNFIDDLNDKDPGKLSKWFNDNSEVWIPPAAPVKGSSRIIALFRAIFRRYSRLQWELTEVHELNSGRCLFLSDSWGMVNELPYYNKIVSDISFDEAGQIVSLSDYFKVVSSAN